MPNTDIKFAAKMSYSFLIDEIQLRKNVVSEDAYNEFRNLAEAMRKRLANLTESDDFDPVPEK